MSAPYKAKALPTLKFKALMGLKIKIEWLIENLVPLMASILIAGDSGVGKTWLLLALILAVATGGKWLGQFRCRQGSVLVIDEENALVLLQDRLRQLCVSLGIGKLEDLPIHFLVGNMVDITPIRDSRTGIETPSPVFLDLLATAQQIKPALVTFDSFIRIHHANENSSNEMRAVTSQISRIARETGATCVISHHFTKSGKSGSGQRIRGTGDVRAFVDLAFLVDECKDGIRITPDKERWTGKIDPFTVKFSQDDKRGAFNITYTGKKTPIKQQTAWGFILDFLKHGAKSRSEIMGAKDGAFSQRQIDDELSIHSAAGELVKSKRGHETLYTLSNPNPLGKP